MADASRTADFEREKRRAKLLSIHRRRSVQPPPPQLLQQQQQERSVAAPRRVVVQEAVPPPAATKNAASSRRAKLEKLQRLRQRRTALSSELEELRGGRRSGNRPGPHRRGTALRTQQQQQQHNDATASSSKNADPNAAAAVEMREIRQKRCLAAAYRLSGISVVPVPEDRDVLALRLDVMSACYHCFFDVAADATGGSRSNNQHAEKKDSSSSGSLHLRLVQHTLPAAIPLDGILQRHWGGSAIKIGSTKDGRRRSDLVVASLLPKLRAVANDLYHASHCLAVRLETFDYLKELAAAGGGTSKSPPPSSSSSAAATQNSNQASTPSFFPPPESRDYTVDHLVCSSSTARSVSFQLHHRLSSIAVVSVSLQYATDLCRPRAQQPLQVTVRTSRREDGGGGGSMATANEAQQPQDEEYYDEFVEGAVLSFRRLPIREAIDEVVDAMQRW